MPVNRKPLKKSILVYSSIFFVFLCVTISAMTYVNYSRSLYQAYERRMTDVIEYVETHIDIEDLSRCVETGVESEKYSELMEFMDCIMDDFDIHFLYIVYPLKADAPTEMQNILSADTHEGRINDPDGLVLNSVIVDAYEPKYLQMYMDALDNDEISFFKDFSEWGYDYTGLKPLINAKGERFALLCVDVEVSELRQTIKNYIVTSVVIIVLLGLVFITIFILWANKTITEPISRLEKSVVAFASKAHNQKDPDMLNYEDPDIHTENEVESLSNAIAQMSGDMKAYVYNILDAEGKVEDMKNQVSRMDMVAYQDALTHVKNKAWYDKTKTRVDDDIIKGKADFAIVMIDLNQLKKINDTYGHEHGNEYIFGSCHQICIIYDHSPVFRIGGDEFVVLLENRDYDHRDQLLKQLKTSFELSSTDEERAPWERYSAAVGMAVFDAENDVSMDDVFKRADTLMYQNKLESKMGREQ